MTKKHFIALADAIKQSPEKFSDLQLTVIANFCKSENYAFDRHRWFSYIKGECGPSGGAVKKRR